MKSLLEFNDRHPAVTTLIGTLSGTLSAGVSWVSLNLDGITAWAGAISTVATCSLALLAVALKLAAGLKRFAQWSRRQARNREQRRRFYRDEPFDESHLKDWDELP